MSIKEPNDGMGIHNVNHLSDRRSLSPSHLSLYRAASISSSVELTLPARIPYRSANDLGGSDVLSRFTRALSTANCNSSPLICANNAFSFIIFRPPLLLSRCEVISIRLKYHAYSAPERSHAVFSQYNAKEERNTFSMCARSAELEHEILNNSSNHQA